MHKYFFAIIGKANCGKTTTIRNINDYLSPYLKKEGYTDSKLTKRRAPRDIAYIYRCTGKPSIGIFSQGDDENTILKRCTQMEKCDILIGAARKSISQFNAVRRITEEQNRKLYILYKSGFPFRDNISDDQWILEQFKHLVQEVLPIN